MTGNLLIAHVEVEPGRRADVAVAQGVVAAIEPIGFLDPTSFTTVLDGRGGAVVPGLADHHVHLLAAAAARESVAVGPETVRGMPAFIEPLRAAERHTTPGVWIRATGYHESVAGALNRDLLDVAVASRPLRVQYRTGSLWCLNSAALALIRPPYPQGVELDDAGVPTGRLWRCDDWLRTQLPPHLPDVGRISSDFLRSGVTCLTDATVTNGADALAVLAREVARGTIRQRLTVMTGRPDVVASAVPAELRLGPVKVLLDEWNLPELDVLAAAIATAHRHDRRVAVHVVTASELVLAVAAFEQAGAVPGDRLEHGGVIPREVLASTAELGLTVVTQPHFVVERGEQYLADVVPNDRSSLYRAGSLLRSGVRLLAGSDAPFGGADPWMAMRAAVQRQTPVTHTVIGPCERISTLDALRLFTPAGDDVVRVGNSGELCVLRKPRRAIGADDLSVDIVRATVARGEVQSW